MNFFHCPKCGSHTFGSNRNTDGTFTRHCTGNRAWECNFIFHENMDHLYLAPDPNVGDSEIKIHITKEYIK